MKEITNAKVFSDSLIINIPPAPFKGGEVTVSIHEKLFRQPPIQKQNI